MDQLTFHTVLTDFGLTKLMSQTSAVGTKTMLAGSPGYQSPEQLRAEGIGTECDIYALGGVICVTVTGKALWPGLSHFQIMHKITSNVKPDVNDLPPPFKSLVDACLCGKTERPQAHQVLTMLLQIASN